MPPTMKSRGKSAATGTLTAAAAVVCLLCIVSPLAPIVAAAASDDDPPPPPPNVIFILAEDMGHGDLPCYSHPYAKAPNLCSRLAPQGTVFNRFYVSGGTCEPSRTGFMTSRDPPSLPNDVADFGFPPGNNDASSERLLTVTNVLKERGGYRTGHVGKFHVGPEDDDGGAGTGDETARRYGIDRSKIMYGVRDGSHVGGKDEAIYDAAVDFIRAWAAEDEANGFGQRKPFYLNIWGHISHSPVLPHPAMVERFTSQFGPIDVDRSLFAGKDIQDKFDRLQSLGGDLNAGMTNYVTEIYSMDLAIGKVLDVLDELGLTDDTVVVFATDHGQAGIDTDSQSTPLNMLGYAGGLRGQKHGFYEGGVRVPFVVRWPDRVPAGVVNDEDVVSALDWLPTVCALAGIDIDDGMFVGEDVSDVWLGDAVGRPRTNPLYWRTANSKGDVAMLWGRWKFHIKRKDVKGTGEVYELYDLATDREESNNLYDMEDYNDLGKRLKTNLQLWESNLPEEYCKLKRGCEDMLPFDASRQPVVVGPPRGIGFDIGPTAPNTAPTTAALVQTTRPTPQHSFSPSAEPSPSPSVGPKSAPQSSPTPSPLELDTSEDDGQTIITNSPSGLPENVQMMTINVTATTATVNPTQNSSAAGTMVVGGGSSDDDSKSISRGVPPVSSSDGGAASNCRRLHLGSVALVAVGFGVWSVFPADVL